MSILTDSKTEILASRTFNTIHASNAEEVPTRIELLRAGSWPASSNKGPLEITEADLIEMKRNFDAGVGLPGQGGTGLPIDFMHEDWAKAAGWITEVEVENGVLYATVEWSTAGKEALLGKEFKCVSPSFYPACLGMWTDPEDASITARNVLVGAGLTNIPFFKDLKPIMASRKNDSEERNVLYVDKKINASEKESTKMPTLEEVRIKEVDALNEEEKTFLNENKEKLTADERKKFGFEEAPAPAASDKPAADSAPAPAPTNASNGSGSVDATVKISAARLQELEATADEFRKQQETAFVEAQVKRGAIKSDQQEAIVKQLIEADAKTRDILHKTYESVPDHPVVTASKQGEDGGREVTAYEQINKLATEKIAASVKEGKSLDRGTAVSEVLRENKELATQYEQEKKGTN
ncbi:MAG TPA: phage protease [Candidatus Saccharibacteria bacterium]|nr:phage protease [Candidatus Saccharibacteria bacterium]